MRCLGCHLANQKEPAYIVFEDDFVCCILDHEPYNDGHVLILPKKHIRYIDELDETAGHSLLAAAATISKAIKILFAPDGISVIQNGGDFDEMTHFHMHVVPRYKNQNFAELYLDNQHNEAVDEKKLEEISRDLIEVITKLS